MFAQLAQCNILQLHTTWNRHKNCMTSQYF